MRSFWKLSLSTLLPAVAAGVIDVPPLAAADPFGRVDRGAAVEPAPQVFINPYAAPAPAKLPSMRLAALGQVVRVDRLSEAYRAAPSGQSTAPGQSNGESPTAQVPTAPAILPTFPSARALAPAASANAPATIPHDRLVTPASYGALYPVAGAASESAGNPLRSAAMPTNNSGNPLR
jgi:hypothetical protein